MTATTIDINVLGEQIADLSHIYRPALIFMSGVTEVLNGIGKDTTPRIDLAVELVDEIVALLPAAAAMAATHEQAGIKAFTFDIVVGATWLNANLRRLPFAILEAAVLSLPDQLAQFAQALLVDLDSMQCDPSKKWITIQMQCAGNPSFTAILAGAVLKELGLRFTDFMSEGI